MSNTFKPKASTEWVKNGYIQTVNHGAKELHEYAYYLMLPTFLANWDVWDYWEKERTEKMAKHLKHGDILFDIGSEVGWLSAVYAQMVGGENMVLFEPTPEFWPNIKETFEHNDLGMPKATFSGLIGKESTPKPKVHVGKWPQDAHADQLIDAMKYRYIHEHGDITEQISIDDFVKQTDIVPRALTMDTEGAEILILQGAVKTLAAHDVLVWVSIHPDLAIANGYGDTQNIHDLMNSLGYKGEFLARDHEDHWLFTKAQS